MRRQWVRAHQDSRTQEGVSMSSVNAQRLSFFLQDPVGSVKYKGRKEMRRVLVRWAERQLRQHGVMDSLSHFVNGRPRGAIGPEFADLWFLYRKVRLTKPKIILEFGSGCSTVTLAHALRENECDGSKSGGYLYSVDADSRWAESTAASMPENLRKFCAVSYSPLRRCRTSRHAGISTCQCSGCRS